MGIINPEYAEFFDSISGGEPFTIDPYRASSLVAADNPVVVIIEGTENIKREGTSDYFTFSFTCRELP